MVTCKCPADAALTTIPAVNCSENFGQIQKIIFQRLQDADGTKNGFTSEAAITKKASWTPLLSANDGTKVVISPIVQAPTSEPGDAITYGGGNDTPGGVELVIGRNPTAFEGVFRMIPQSVIKAMKALQCESFADNLGVYLVDENGAIEGLKGTAEGEAYPIPIRSLFISDKGHGGLEEPDSNNISFSFLPNYSDDLGIFTPEDFNALTDLVPPTA